MATFRMTGLKAWLPEDDLAHLAVTAVERVLMGAFQVNERAGGKR
jgi:hypothetical protein